MTKIFCLTAACTMAKAMGETETRWLMQVLSSWSLLYGGKACKPIPSQPRVFLDTVLLENRKGIVCGIKIIEQSEQIATEH